MQQRRRGAEARGPTRATHPPAHPSERTAAPLAPLVPEPCVVSPAAAPAAPRPPLPAPPAPPLPLRTGLWPGARRAPGAHPPPLPPPASCVAAPTRRTSAARAGAARPCRRCPRHSAPQRKVDGHPVGLLQVDLDPDPLALLNLRGRRVDRNAGEQVERALRRVAVLPHRARSRGAESAVHERRRGGQQGQRAGVPDIYIISK